MSKICILGFMFLCFACSSSPKKVAVTYPVIEIDSIVDLGRISIKERSYFNVKYKNIGKKPLRIGLIDSPCGCLAGQANDKAVAVNDTASVQFGFLPTSGGYISKDSYIYFDGYSEPVRVKIKAFAFNP